jgi:hypothetical protein
LSSDARDELGGLVSNHGVKISRCSKQPPLLFLLYKEESLYSPWWSAEVIAFTMPTRDLFDVLLLRFR